MESNEAKDDGKAFKHLTKYFACFSLVNSLQSSIVYRSATDVVYKTVFVMPLTRIEINE